MTDLAIFAILLAVGIVVLDIAKNSILSKTEKLKGKHERRQRHERDR